ncbi:hypothetical protein SLA2020_080320 [Shorea laevis]
MAEIFRMTVPTNYNRTLLRLSDLDFQQLPDGEFPVRDNRSDRRTWRCRRSQRPGGQYYLEVIDWNDFKEGIEAGSEISLHKEDDHFGSGDSYYIFKVGN